MGAKIDLSPEALQKRREIANKATQGDDFPKWATQEDILKSESCEVPLIAEMDMEHILANNPANVLAMIYEIEILRHTMNSYAHYEYAWLSTTDEHNAKDKYGHTMLELIEINERLRKENEELKEKCKGLFSELVWQSL